jgi:alkaline phosphatase
VILLVADGAGYNTWKAVEFYTGEKAPVESEPWFRIAVSTHALRQSALCAEESLLVQDPGLLYDPVAAWSPEPVAGEKGGFPFRFEGYRWLRRAPDSANTGTALSTGRKTYVGAINVDGASRPIEETLAALAHGQGMRVGVVTTVPLCHATPATLGGAHSPDRHRYPQIAWEMLTAGLLDVIAGCGNPDFDNNGRRIRDEESKDYRYVGGREVWEFLTGAEIPVPGDTVTLADGTRRALTESEAAALSGWDLVQDERAIRSLGRGRAPERLLVLPEVGQRAFFVGRPGGSEERHLLGGTLQQERGSAANARFTEPGFDPPVAGVPGLADLTRAALNSLDDGENGFFLHVEGGAVDWAMHDRQMGRMIEEMIDFRGAIEAVIDWVETHSSWEETLVLVTSDHDHLLWGPDADTVPFDPLQDRGPEEIPAYQWLTNQHSAALVPLFARGPGADRLAGLAGGEDPVRGPYLDQTDVFRVMQASLGLDTLAARRP